jgi:thiol-disulfide isomerase/thioredoxin
MFRLAIVVGLAVFVGRSIGDEPEKTWQIRGQVVDEAGRPVEDFEAGFIWSSNGKQWDEAGAPVKYGPDELGKFWKEEGVPAAWPKWMAKRLPGGKFEITIEDRPRVAIFATDKSHTRGGYVAVEKKPRVDGITIKLVPLTRVHGKIFCADAGLTPDWTMAGVHVVGDRENYLQFTMCGSIRGEFAFRLPPGKYDLDVYSGSPDARMPKPHERKAKDAPADMPPYLSGIRIDVPAKGELDLGTLNVQLPRDKDGVPHSYAMFYGKEPPKLEITDARGVAKSVKLSDFGGKWVLVDFWALWCGPCVGRSLPDLTKFYEKHAADRGRFEILAVCNTQEEKAQTIAAFDALAKPIAEKFWGGKQLPYPVLIDGEAKTSTMYGIQHWPTVLLIDPEGHLVKNGDETRLEKELGKNSRRLAGSSLYGADHHLPRWVDPDRSAHWSSQQAKTKWMAAHGGGRRFSNSCGRNDCDYLGE